MKTLTVFLLIISLCFSVQAQEVKKGEIGGVEISAKSDRPLDVGLTLSADPNIHQAVYAVMKDKGISGEGLSTRKDGTVTIIKSSSDDPKITVAEIQAKIDSIKQGQDIEALIQAEIRAMAVKNLISQGKIPADSK